MKNRSYAKRVFRRHIPAITPKGLLIIYRRVLDHVIKKFNLKQHKDDKHSSDYFCWTPVSLFRFLIEITSDRLSTQIKGFSGRFMNKRRSSRLKKTGGRCGAAIHPSAQGLYLARQSFPFQILQEAFQVLTSEILQSLFKYYGNKWITVIIDGMNVPMNPAKADPENLVKAANGEIRAAMHLNGALIPDWDLFLDVEMQPGSMKNEHEAALILVKRVTERIRKIYPKKNILFIMDRGYFSFNLATACEELGVSYLIRIQEKVFKTYLNGEEVGCEMDFRSGAILIDWKMAVQAGFGPKDLEKLPNFIRKNVTGRGIEAVESHDGRYVFEARLAAVEINSADDKDKEQFEYLITNLSEEDYDLRSLKAEYKNRWQVEVNYFLLKHGDGLIYLHSAKKNLVLQEVYAYLFQHNRAAVLLNRKENTTRQGKYVHVPLYTANLKPIRKWFMGTLDIPSDELLCEFYYTDNNPDKEKGPSDRKRRGAESYSPRR